MSDLKPIPKFVSEDEEREFWGTHDTTEYFDYSKAIPNPYFLRLAEERIVKALAGTGLVPLVRDLFKDRRRMDWLEIAKPYMSTQGGKVPVIWFRQPGEVVMDQRPDALGSLWRDVIDEAMSLRPDPENATRRK